MKTRLLNDLFMAVPALVGLVVILVILLTQR